jgi:C4-dicarboxylate transporter, DctM subunit
VVGLGGIYSGLVTVTEASALGAIAAFLLVTVFGRMTRTVLHDALSAAVRVSTMIFTIIIGGLLFSRLLAFAGVPFALVRFVDALDVRPVAMVVVMLLILAGLGMFIDPVGMIMLTLPFFFPVVTGLGLDPIWFGVLVVLQAELGVITPPVGVHLFLVRQLVPDVPLGSIIRGTLPFMLCQVVVIALVVAFPELALWLPGRMR